MVSSSDGDQPRSLQGHIFDSAVDEKSDLIWGDYLDSDERHLRQRRVDRRLRNSFAGVDDDVDVEPSGDAVHGRVEDAVVKSKAFK